MFKESNSKGLRSLLPRADPNHRLYPWLVLINILIGAFMAILDSSIVNVALPNIMNSFGTSVDIIEWIMTAYLLMLAVMLPASGWIADHFGYKRTYFTGLLLFTLGSFLCGIAWNEGMLIVFRIIQGLGGGLLTPVGMAFIMRAFPHEKRGMALGFWGVAAAASVSFGPTIGGYLIDNFNWHAIFLVNIPVGIVGLAGTVIIQKEYRTENIRSFDYGGAFSMVVFLAFLLLALACGNSSWNTGGWTSDFIITCFTLSAIGLALFLYIELRAKHPIVELKILKDFNFSLANLVFFIFGFGMFGSTFLLPLYLQNSLGYTTLQAGLVFLPIGFIQAVVSPISGSLSDRINPKIINFVGIIVLGTGLYLQYFLSLYSSNDQIMIPLIIRGFGMGMIFGPLTNLAMAKIPREKVAQASGIINLIRQLGGSFGIAVMGTILSHQVLMHTANYGLSLNNYSPVFRQVMTVIQNIIHKSSGRNIKDSMELSRVLILQNAVNQAFIQAICDDFLIATIVTFACLIPIFLLRYRKKAKGKIAPPVSIE